MDHQVIEEKGIPYEKLDILANRSTPISVLSSYLSKYPETNVIFLVAADGAEAALTMAKEQGLNGKVYLTTFNVTEKILEGIRDGVMLCTVEHQPFSIRFMAVEKLFVCQENLSTIEKQVKVTK